MENQLENNENNFNNYDPFKNPVIDSYCSENEAKVYLTREDILELGFLRSNPTRFIYVHKDNKNLVLEQFYQKNYSVKDLVEERIVVFDYYRGVVLYDTTKPNKKDIQQVIDNYAG